MQLLNEAITNVNVGAATSFAGLTVFPVFSKNTHVKDYLTLDEALQEQLARVTEVSESGSVPTLFFENLGEHRILLVDGDELVGAKQNRVINLSIMVPGHTRLEIPVSCVEAGRWAYADEEFSSRSRTMHARARASKAHHVSEDIALAGKHRSDQGDVWDSIAECSMELGVESPTQSMSDMYEQREERLADYRKAFKSAKEQVGAVFALAGKVQGMELFDSSDAFTLYRDRLVASYALELMGSGSPELEIESKAAAAFVSEIQNAHTERFDALGEGADVRILGEALSGGALAVDERIVHLSAFRLDPDSDRGRGRHHRRHPRDVHPEA